MKIKMSEQEIAVFRKLGGYTLVLSISLFIFLSVAFPVYRCCCNQDIDYLSRISLIVNASTFLVACFSLYIANKTLKESKNSTDANFIMSCNAQYFSKDMQTALKCLWDFHDALQKAGKDRLAFHFSKTYRTETNNPNEPISVLPSKDKSTLYDICLQLHSTGIHSGSLAGISAQDLYQQVDLSRRTVKAYFHNLYELIEYGKIDEATFLIAANKGGIKTYFHIVEPLECLVNPRYDYHTFHGMMAYTMNIFSKRKNDFESSTR